MITAVTIVTRHGSPFGELAVVNGKTLGPEVPLHLHRAFFKSLPAKVHKDYATVQLFESSSGVTHSRKFITPAEHDRHVARMQSAIQANAGLKDKDVAEAQKRAEQTNKFEDKNPAPDAKEKKPAKAAPKKPAAVEPTIEND